MYYSCNLWHSLRMRKKAAILGSQRSSLVARPVPCQGLPSTKSPSFESSASISAVWSLPEKALSFGEDMLPLQPPFHWCVGADGRIALQCGERDCLPPLDLVRFSL